MDHPQVQQRGFVAPVPMAQASTQRPNSGLGAAVSGSQQGRESLLSRALRRDLGENEEGEVVMMRPAVGLALETVVGGVPKPILRRASCVEPSCANRIEERGDQEKDDPQPYHPVSIFPQPSSGIQQQQQSEMNQQQPVLARKTSLKFAIAPPPVHGLVPHGVLLEAPHPGSRRSSVDAAGVVEGDMGDGVAERLIGDIEEDDEDLDEDDEDLDNQEEEDDEDSDEQEDDGEYNDDSISIHDDGDEQQSSEAEDDRYSSTNWSGYEEDSEAGLSDEELAVKETLVVSPVGRRRLPSRGSAEDVDGSTAFGTDRATPATHFSSIASPQHPSFAFARPTNYRRRRPTSVASDGGAGAPVGGGSISSLLAVGGSSFVKIDPAERLHRGRGAVQILDPIPQGGRATRKAGTETDTCTRHCSPPPAKDRSRSSSRSVPPAVSGISHTLRPPRADLSPSAIRMQARRGHSDPRKKRQRPEVAQMNLFGPNGRVARALTTDDDLADRRLDTTEDELALEARTSMTRGWRSDDALFAVPMVRRYPAAMARYLPPDAASRKNSLKSLTKYPTTSSATLSDVEHVEPLSDGLVDAGQVMRRPSEKVPRRASTCSAPPNGLLSPTEPTIAYFGASVPCPPAVDDTPALASGTSFCPSTPVDQILHETLAGTPSRRRGSDVTPNVVPHVKTTEGSGSDGYRSRASSAMGFRSDDGRVQPHHSVYSTPQHHQQSISYVPVRKGYFEEAAEAPRSLSTTHVTPGIQPCKSRPIKCPSPRRRTQDDVRT